MPSSINAGLAKRLAEAADTFRDGLYHYFVCRTTFPYDLYYTAGYESEDDASEAADTLKIEHGLSDDYHKFGPYKTTNCDKEKEAPIEYDLIQVRFMQGNNELSCEAFSADTDVIILSLSAYEKFFEPYYTKLYGIDVAAGDLRNAVVNALTTPRTAVIHRGGKSSQTGTGGTRLIAGSYELG